jgi:hypothetical protein
MSPLAPRTASALPIRMGMMDGTNAHFIVDANGEVIGSLFGIVPGLTLAEAYASPSCAKGLATAEQIVSSVNAYGNTRAAYDGMVAALRIISATSKGVRIPKLALEALKNAGEI